jgi:hypothetical protein
MGRACAVPDLQKYRLGEAACPLGNIRANPTPEQARERSRDSTCAVILRLTSRRAGGARCGIDEQPPGQCGSEAFGSLPKGSAQRSQQQCYMCVRGYSCMVARVAPE